MNFKVKILGKEKILFAKFEGCRRARKRSVTFLISHTFVYIFFRMIDAVRGKNYRQMYGKIKNVTERFLALRQPSNLATKFFSKHLNFTIHKLSRIQFL